MFIKKKRFFCQSKTWINFYMTINNRNTGSLALSNNTPRGPAPLSRLQPGSPKPEMTYWKTGMPGRRQNWPMTQTRTKTSLKLGWKARGGAAAQGMRNGGIPIPNPLCAAWGLSPRLLCHSQWQGLDPTLVRGKIPSPPAQGKTEILK